MSRVSYVNGRYVAHRDARVSVEDRGFQFADGVYEVCEVNAGRLIDEDGHLDRLDRSLGELAIPAPCSRAALQLIMRQVIGRNLVRNGLVYVQITRGVAPRDHGFPASGTRASLVVSAHGLDSERIEARAAAGVLVATVADIRWRRPDIKSISLLPNVLARQAARAAQAQEAWLVDDAGYVTEGAASNAWIVTRDGAIVTRSADRSILRGVTRTRLLACIEASGMSLQERAFSVPEACAAAEAFYTGATAHVMPVVAIDGHAIGTGRPGPVALQLRRALSNDR